MDNTCQPVDIEMISWKMNPPVRGTKHTMVLLTALQQYGTNKKTDPNQRLHSCRLFHTIKEQGLTVANFSDKIEDAQVLASALDEFHSDNAYSVLFADDAKHSLSKFLHDYKPIYYDNLFDSNSSDAADDE